MTAYIVIFALCAVIAVQAVIYYRERLKLYDILKSEKENAVYNSRDKPQYSYKTQRGKSAHKRAREKWVNGGWRNGGDSE